MCDMERVGGDGVRCGFHQNALYSCIKFSNYEKIMLSLSCTHTREERQHLNVKIKLLYVF